MKQQVRTMLEKATEILRKLITCKTISDSSNLEVIEWIANYAEQNKIRVHRYVCDYSNDIENMILSIGPEGPGGICFSGHLDVVPPQETGWKYDPFKLTNDIGRLYGRGTTDMKGFLAIILAFLPHWNTHDLRCPIQLVLTYDEEIGCKGIRDLLNKVDRESFSPKALILGEPTLCKPINAHKGGAECTTEIQGLAGHASKPDNGSNAIYAAVDIINVLRDYQKRIQNNPNIDSKMDPPYTTMSVGTITGGDARNIIADHCVFMWEVRTIPGIDAKEVVHDIEKDFAHINCVNRCSIRTTIVDSYPGLLPRTDSPSLRLLRTMNCMDEADEVSFGTEAGYFDSFGIPTVVWGPGSITEAHTVNEYITIEQMETCITYLLRLSPNF